MTIEIIAENAQGFEGSSTLTMQLLRAAAAAGATAAKYQLVYADELATPDYEYYDMNKGLEMPDDIWSGLADYADSLGLELIFDIFGAKSLKLAETLGSRTVMLHATDITNMPLINLVSTGPISRVILGAGGAHLPEIRDALEALKNKNVCVMLGYQGYPTPDEHNQISRIKYLKEWLIGKYENVTVGFSDHSLPDSCLISSLSAMALGAGATSFEKHLTISQAMKYEDYESAINPDQFFKYVEALSACSEAFGSVLDQPDFGMSSSEFGYRKFVRRHVVTLDSVQAGTIVYEKDFVFKRSSLDNVITNVGDIIGKKTVSDLHANQPVTLADFE
jgi:N,N'-diacetyllegionaminate synthase